MCDLTGRSESNILALNDVAALLCSKTIASTCANPLIYPTTADMPGMNGGAAEFVPSRPVSSASLPDKPSVKAEGSTSAASTSAPVNNRKRPLANPSMIPQQPRLPKTMSEKEATRRLYVVLSQACLETYQVSVSGANRRDGRMDNGREERYTLLNCDDHVGRSTLLENGQANLSIAARHFEQDGKRGRDCQA